ncbi:hypothetical protein ACFQPG_11985 [Sphingomonas sp. GCM10030256]|uniref:hypothetical protein n=1 Tax=Sphingomonas sp. GCM10030256 TaxID=3273427 RepID=UPI003610CEF8
MPSPVDECGLDVPWCLSRAVERSSFYLTPTVQFPTGAKLRGERRDMLLDWAAEHGGPIIENDHDAHFRFDGQTPRRPLKADGRSASVVYISSFNRTLFPSLRLAFLVASPPLRERLLRRYEDTVSAGCLPNQIVPREFIDEGGYSAHLRRLQSLLRERRDALLAILRPYLGTVLNPPVNRGSLHLVLNPVHENADHLVRRLRAVGIASVSLRDLAIRARVPNALLLGFAGFPEAAIEAAAPALRATLDPIVSRTVGNRQVASLATSGLLAGAAARPSFEG